MFYESGSKKIILPYFCAIQKKFMARTLVIGDIHEPFCKEGYLEFCKTPECTYGDLNSEQWPMSFGLFNRQSDSFKNRFLVKEHESETALDNAEFDYVIDNNGTIEDLITTIHKTLNHII